MKVWTYETAPDRGWYWNSASEPLVYIEGDGIPAHFRRVSDGSKECYQSSSINAFRGQPLPRQYWPQWLLDLDECYIDEGL